jgi:hypothetical protein
MEAGDPGCFALRTGWEARLSQRKPGHKAGNGSQWSLATGSRVKDSKGEARPPGVLSSAIGYLLSTTVTADCGGMTIPLAGA